VWEWFVEVFDPSDGRLLKFSEIDAYARMTNQMINANEARVLRQLSQTYLRVQSEKKRPGVEGAKNLTDMSDTKGIRRIFMSKGDRRPRAKAVVPPKPEEVSRQSSTPQ
jgi:hypothetical protein